MSSTTTPATQETPKLPIVYVGPTSSKLGLVRFHHYIEPLNTHIQELLDKYPALKILFVPLEQFGDRAQAIYAGNDSTVKHASAYLTKKEVF